MQNKKVAIYVRVSSQEQKKEGLSIDVQIKKLTEFCQVKDFEIYEIYKDEGISGGSMNRAGMKKMLEDCNSGKINAILVYKLDRFSRNIIDTIYTLNDLNNKGIDFISLTESFDTSTAMGRAFMKLLSIFSEMEREVTKERVEMVFEEKIKNGLPSIPPPFGYKYNPKKFWIIDEKKAEIVREVNKDRINKINYKKTIEKLKIDRFTYYRIIKNIEKGIYNGFVVYNKKIKDVRGNVIKAEEIKYKGRHDAII